MPFQIALSSVQHSFEAEFLEQKLLWSQMQIYKWDLYKCIYKYISYIRHIKQKPKIINTIQYMITCGTIEILTIWINKAIHTKIQIWKFTSIQIFWLSGVGLCGELLCRKNWQRKNNCFQFHIINSQLLCRACSFTNRW